MPTTAEYERMLRDADLRVTRPRVAVLDAVHGLPHADTESIIGAARADLSDVSHQAVYDVLRALTAAGLVRRIQPSGAVARYESRVGDGHAPCLTASDDHGFTVDEAEVIYWGTCPDCAARGA
jgi:Fe2+ or Zn2+ uptake regulation protein